MSTQDFIILILNIVCLLGSIIGALKARNSYKKCKQLTNFANLKVALEECQLVFSNCRKLLTYCDKDFDKDSKNLRGINCEKEISDCGNAISISFSKIKDILPSSAQNEVNIILTQSFNQKWDIEKLVSLLISGYAYKNKDVTEDNIPEIQKAVNNIHLLIKKEWKKYKNKKRNCDTVLIP